MRYVDEKVLERFENALIERMKGPLKSLYERGEYGDYPAIEVEASNLLAIVEETIADFDKYEV